MIMADVSETTLRLDILRDAAKVYQACSAMIHATDAERKLCALKIAECEAMMRELLNPKGPAA